MFVLLGAYSIIQGKLQSSDQVTSPEQQHGYMCYPASLLYVQCRFDSILAEAAGSVCDVLADAKHHNVQVTAGQSQIGGLGAKKHCVGFPPQHFGDPGHCAQCFTHCLPLCLQNRHTLSPCWQPDLNPVGTQINGWQA